MADGQQVTTTTTEGADDSVKEQKAIDWEAKYNTMRKHMRDWESKAKANQDAADELEKLKAESKTEQEKAVERAEKAEEELKKLKAEAERSRIISDVAAKCGVTSDVVAMLNGADEEELTQQVDIIKHTLFAAPVRSDDGGGSLTVKKSNVDKFAENLGIF